MKFDFDRPVERRGSGCVKWDRAPEGAIPIFIADMDFPAAPAITRAVRERTDHGVFGYGLTGDEVYRAGILPSDGKDFGQPGYVRLNFGTRRALLTEALDRREGALEKGGAA